MPRQYTCLPKNVAYLAEVLHATLSKCYAKLSWEVIFDIAKCVSGKINYN